MTRCWMHNPDENYPAVARILALPSHNIIPICTPCLDHWLDGADDDPDMEPGWIRWLPA